MIREQFKILPTWISFILLEISEVFGFELNKRAPCFIRVKNK